MKSKISILVLSVCALAFSDSDFGPMMKSHNNKIIEVFTSESGQIGVKVGTALSVGGAVSTNFDGGATDLRYLWFSQTQIGAKERLSQLLTAMSTGQTVDILYYKPSDSAAGGTQSIWYYATTNLHLFGIIQK